MNEYLTSPVTPIVISVLAIAISIAVFIKVAGNRRKRREDQAKRRADLQVAREIEQALARKRSATAISLKQAAKDRDRGTRDIPPVPRERNVPRRLAEVPPVSKPVTRESEVKRPARHRKGTYQPGRHSRTDIQQENNGHEALTNMGLNAAILGGMFSYEDPGTGRSHSAPSDDSPKHDPSPSTSSNDSSSGWSSDSGGGGSYDSGSSSSSDSGSFGGGDSGSF